ncbi:MAG: enoyl-CoA hydratase [Mesorhizobium amorphae]|nr:MAG: enoyl-CoA hydratase [Mesorhizobium amorphae]
MSERLNLRIEGATAVLAIARPERANALDMDLLRAIERACDRIEGEDAVRAAILTGEGKAFSAGGDIKAWGAMSPQEFGTEWIRLGHRVFDRLASLRMPLISAINGHALGGGLELAATADIRVAETQSRIGLPETGLGMVPGWSGTQRLVRRFGAGVVRRMALGGEVFLGEEARALGLIDHVAETGGALSRALELAAGIAERGPAAVALAKLMINTAEGESREAGVETLAGILAAKTGDLREGVTAFGEKRAPRFQGEW